MLYVLKRDQNEHVRLRALAQAIINKEKGKEVFDEYMKIAFPWLETKKQRDKSDHINLLAEEVKRGGLAIKPLWQEQKVRSRLKTRVIEKEAAPQKTKTQMNKLYDKLGKVIPL
jgi:hypothetical protein